MNDRYNIFIYSTITTQHLLNKPLDKRGINKRVLYFSQRLFLIVEYLLRVYAVYYQYGYILIHQFNKRIMVL